MNAATIPTPALSPAEIRQAIEDHPKTRARDLAQTLNLPEAALLAARLGHGVRGLAAHPDKLVPLFADLGEVMALTRNDHVVHEKVGTYGGYRSGARASMVLPPHLDLRFFPAHWVHAYAVETEKPDGGIMRSIQVFDAAGDAVHKVYLRDGSNLDAWARLITVLADDTTPQSPDFEARPAVEAPKSDLTKLEDLRREWAALRDTHHFPGMISKLGMNRLGAHRIVGAPFARPLKAEGLNEALLGFAEAQVPIMIFVGNRGCIQIHSGPITQLKTMGPWQNVLDPDFNLHLRLDHVAEVWLIEKPTARGPAVSIEAFDAAGDLILQVFRLHKEDGPDHSAAFLEITRNLPLSEEISA